MYLQNYMLLYGWVNMKLYLSCILNLVVCCRKIKASCNYSFNPSHYNSFPPRWYPDCFYISSNQREKLLNTHMHDLSAGRTRHRTGRVLAITLPIAGAILALIVLTCFCFWRRRTPARKASPVPCKLSFFRIFYL